MSNDRTTYDTVPYPGHALAQAHPDRLATIATLFGMKPPEVRQCRVLELGCGDGLNLTSVALGLPEAQCLGVDLAATGIRRAHDRARHLGLSNVKFESIDLLEINADFGKFDYIISHGLYSWVPEIVRDKLLSICAENLSENGVAYVSYNTYPGGHFRDLARNMMLFHVSDFANPRQRVSQARALVKFIIDAGTEPDIYRMVLQKELERLDEFTDSSLYHDDLGEHNAPVYFYQFVDHAARHGLKYLSEAHFFEVQTGIFSEKVVEVLNRMADSAVAREQYLDFLKCRRFRQTLLCHKDRVLDDVPRPEKTALFHIASPVRPASPDVSISARDQVNFIGPKNSSIQTDNPLIKGALVALGKAWPKALPFDDLLETAQSSCGSNSSAVDNSDALTLGELLLRAYAGGIVEFNLVPPRLVTFAAEKPIASPLARLLSRESPDVVNLRHFNIRVEDFMSRFLLPLLDGEHDRGNLVHEAMALIKSGVAIVERNSPPTASSIEENRNSLAVAIEQRLAELAEMALLLA